ncbi:unnamed protein product [Cyclocybe aegerita]|uniref:Serine/threonine-protein phosphatase 1 regulatory subunit 10 n=1 Tax=Cyclocybe aegerita TaxID=1973307 RepID=A0A8S0WD74_CYCAE|nr:unnamed protein product [Cyclocybe aegerita]
MDSSMYTQWVQSNLPEPPQHVQHHLQHDARPHPSLVDDWNKDRSAQLAQSSSAGVSSPSLTSPTIDMNDFTTLGDLGATASSILSASPQAFYSQYVNPSFLMQTHGLHTHSPFTTMAYGTPWPNLPVSNYSSLNGATTSTSTLPVSVQQQQQQQQQQQPSQQQPSPPLQNQQPIQQQQQSHLSTSQQLMIDPILTMNNGVSSLNMSPFPQSPTYSTQQQQSQSQLQRTFSYNTQAMLYPFYRPSPQAPPQGTLSPQALHSPPNSMMTIPPNSFYTAIQPSPAQSQPANPSQPNMASSSQNVGTAEAPSAKPGPTPEELEARKEQFLESIRPLLQSSAFTGAQAVQHLTDRIVDFGIGEVDASTRLDILARIRDGAGNHYYRAWSENEVAVDLTYHWMKAAAKDGSGALVETIMPLLHLIDRLPLTLDMLAKTNFGKIIKKLGKDGPSPAIKDMASNLERRWRSMLAAEKDEDNKAKKRKISDSTAPAKSSVPPKKAALGNSTSTKPVVVKKEVKPAPAPVKDAKADSSFFSAPKAKAKLPSFKKAPASVVVKKEETSTPLPGSFDPFKEVLKSMKTARKDSPAAPTPPPTSVTPSGDSQTGLAKNGKKKKSVMWAPDGQLEAIKLIERAVYDDDPVDGTHVAHSLRDLDRGEGAALHAHMFEEVVDWSEPMLVELPPDPDPHQRRPERGYASQERSAQEEREQTALSAIYMSASQIPDSPAEPGTVLTEEETDKDVPQIQVGSELEVIFWADPVPPVPPASVADLVGQLALGAAGGANMLMDHSMPPTDIDSQAALAGLQPDQLQQLLQQLSANTAAGVAQPTAPQYGQQQAPALGAYGTDAWGQATSTPSHFGGDYGTAHGGYSDGLNDPGEPSQAGRWSGGTRGTAGMNGLGRARGRPYNRRKQPCTFYAQGRCRYGDHCDYAHDGP